MIENEAIENLKYLISDNCTDSAHDYIEEIETAIKALKEIQQYRKLGTVNECQTAVKNLKALKERNLTSKNMEEYMMFEDECVKKGFSFNSLLKAREKQTAKKMRIIGNSLVCPSCSKIFKNDTVKYCPNCGQKLN